MKLRGDELHHGERQPSLGVRLRTDLSLREVKQRDDRRLLPPLRILSDDRLRRLRVGVGPRKARPARALLGVIEDGSLSGHQG